MQLVVGLGNPGKTYAKHRHNVGFRFLDLLAHRLGLSFSGAPRFYAEIAVWQRNGDKVLLAKPQTYMNLSGKAVAALSSYYRVSSHDIYVIYDDLDLPKMKIRIRRGGGHGGHNGIKSINQSLADTDYTRIRIGIGRPEEGEITPWVLGPLTQEEKEIEERVFSCLLQHFDLILEGNAPLAANRIHQCIHAGEKTDIPDQEKAK